MPKNLALTSKQAHMQGKRGLINKPGRATG